MPLFSRAIVDLTNDDDSEDEAPRYQNPRPRTNNPEIIEILDSESPSPQPTPLRSSSKNVARRSESKKRDGGHIRGERHVSKRVATTSTRPGASGSKVSTPFDLPNKTLPIAAQKLTASNFAPRKNTPSLQPDQASKPSARRSHEPPPDRPSKSATCDKPFQDAFSQNEFPNLPGTTKPSVLHRTKTPSLPRAQTSRICSPAPVAEPSHSRRSFPGKRLSKNGPERISGQHRAASLSSSTPEVAKSANQDGQDDSMTHGLLLQEDRRGFHSEVIQIDKPNINVEINTQNTLSVNRRAKSTSMMPAASGTDDQAQELSSKPRQKEENVGITVAEIEELLSKLDLEMRETHAAAVSVLLEDARTEGRPPQTFIDEVSPFASMSSVKVNPGDRKSTRKPSEPVDTFVSTVHS
jgi:hypothetical protein